MKGRITTERVWCGTCMRWDHVDHPHAAKHARARGWALTSNEHKVRSFQGNILDPTNPFLLTVDTHSIGAVWLEPMGSKSPEVKK